MEKVLTATVFADNVAASYDTEARRIWWGGEKPFDQTFPNKEVADIAWLSVLTY